MTIFGDLNADHAADGPHPKPFIPGTLLQPIYRSQAALAAPRRKEHRAFKSSSASAGPSIFEHWNDRPRLNLWTE